MKTAYWIRRTRLFRPAVYICSACRSSGSEAPTLCPVCGARMKRTRDDPAWADELEELSAILDD